MNLKLEHEQDFYTWIQHQVELLKQGQFSEMDIENLIEELDSMGVSQKRELRSRLRVLIMHLLKWQFQPTHRSQSWDSTILNQRQEITDVLKDSPSLKRQIPNAIVEVYEDAIKSASKETHLPQSIFPRECPYTIERLLDDEFYPEN